MPGTPTGRYHAASICLPLNLDVIALRTLDPRAPLVLDTHELGRSPGSERRVSRTVPAPADLGIEVMRVPEGSPVLLSLRLEAVLEGALVTGTASAGLDGECVRCLAPIRSEVAAEFQELYVYPDGRDAAQADEVSAMDGDLLDLEPVVRDALVLALPLRPLCDDDCPGLCPDCGARLADVGDHGHEDRVDPRWATLGGLTLEEN